MDISMLAKDADDLIRTNRVYADPITVGDTTIIPAARVGGGGGVGGGTGPVVTARPADSGAQGTAAAGAQEQADTAQGSGEGEGGGFGFGGRPIGAFIVKDGKVSWQPAVDVNRLMLVVGAVAIAALVAARGIVKAQQAG